MKERKFGRYEGPEVSLPVLPPRRLVGIEDWFLLDGHADLRDGGGECLGNS